MNKAKNTVQAMQLPVNKLRPFEGHPFQVKDDAEMDQLVWSILTQGVLTPITVRPLENNEYEVISGHRRLHVSDSGEMLSLGQSQCLALARIFINPEKQLYILDEPTSALDPIAEEEIFETINSYLADKTVIYISHRFSASKIADKIYFMESGQIVEQGTHDELIRQSGKYADMFNLQAKYYRNDAEACIE